MSNVPDEELIKAAENALNSQNLGEFYVGDVGCALVSKDDQIFIGVSIGGYLGICAEQNAISSMVSKDGPKIKKLIAVWKDENGELFALPPCGRCREFLRLISQDNLEADIILGKDHIVKLKDLLPVPMWHAEKL